MDAKGKKSISASDERPPALAGHSSLLSTLIEILKVSWVSALIALISAVGLIFLFALLTDEIFDKELVGLDTNLAIWSYGLASPVLTFFLTIITDIGSPVGIGVLTAITFVILIWRKLMVYGWLGVLIIAGSAVVDETLKLIFRRARPELLSGGQHLSSYSFPSGHATGAICFSDF